MSASNKKDQQIKNLTTRLDNIAKIIEDVDNRCMAVDGPVTPTLNEMTQKEMSMIYKYAKEAA